MLPTAWYRNTWSWDDDGERPGAARRRRRRAVDDRAPVPRRARARRRRRPDGAAPSCSSATTRPTPSGSSARRRRSRYPKDGINDHVVARRRHGQPGAHGHEGGVLVPRRRSPPGETVELRAAAAARRRATATRGPDFADVAATRRAEADEFYAELTPAGVPRRRGERDAPGLRRDAVGQAALLLRRRALARRRPDAAARRRTRGSTGRNARWRNFDAFDIMSMPDPWEYPWFAAWDMAFHCVALAHVDPAFAKYQLTLLCREWFQHPNGALPAYEWAFDDVNPPVQAWAALEVFAIDGGRDIDVPEPDLRQAARQLHLVGQPRGRGRLERLRGRLPRARQHRADRPLAPAAGLHARAVRRDRLDGVVRADAWRRSRSILNRHGSRPRPTSC